jgi:hypothetical protein
MNITTRISILLLLAGLSACSKVSDTAGIPSAPVIEGEVTPASYADAARKALAHAAPLINSGAPREEEMDVDIARLEGLLALSAQGGLDDEKKHEAPLMSSLGVLYAQKANINKNAPRIAGEFIAKSIRSLDRAISLHPQNLDSRISRGLVFSKVPSFLGKAEVAYEDLKYVQDSADFGKLPSRLQDTVRRVLAELESELANAELAP